ncbi:MAG: hypothetical protein OSB58_17935 [Alphaproteobacteria bacterium]|nr:hypothetical protein [Alphaproteobacteria bacterium]
MNKVYDPRMPAAEDCVLARLLEKWAAAKPDAIAIIFDGGESWTWSEALNAAGPIAG